METWTRQRPAKKGKKSSAFRESFGKLGELRSFCKEGTPVGALTGTADETTQTTIKEVLCMKTNCRTIYVSPNRLNLRFSVEKCGGVQCDEAVLPFEETMQEDSCSDECSNVNQREVTTEERATLKEALCEIKRDVTPRQTTHTEGPVPL
ncbi:uncharacterized protein [Montipora capricornis]|uniref:uncharacterized protein n=1 Tax=Montipora capricornis TaxID=246305 RepID=UPI0035F11D83